MAAVTAAVTDLLDLAEGAGERLDRRAGRASLSGGGETKTTETGGGRQQQIAHASHSLGFWRVSRSAFKHKILSESSIRNRCFPRAWKTLTWNGIVAPSGTPVAIINRVAAAVQDAVSKPEFRARLWQLGVDPIGNTPAQFAETLRADSATWAEAAKASNLKIE